MQKNKYDVASLHQPEPWAKDTLKKLLYTPPHQSWVKLHPMAKKKNAAGQVVQSEYLPVDKVEYLLDLLFDQWKVEVLNVTAIFNSVAVTVRLHYLHPETMEWRFHDGVGAKSVQMDAGASASDLTKIKDAGVMMALPAAKSYALKDAAEHLGPLFGRDINRLDPIQEWSGNYRPATTPDQAPAQAQAPAPAPNTANQLNGFNPLAL